MSTAVRCPRAKYLRSSRPRGASQSDKATRVPEARVPGPAVVLAATDPANVYGAALPWPERSAGGSGDGSGDATVNVLV